MILVCYTIIKRVDRSRHIETRGNTLGGKDEQNFRKHWNLGLVITVIRQKEASRIYFLCRWNTVATCYALDKILGIKMLCWVLFVDSSSSLLPLPQRRSPHFWASLSPPSSRDMNNNGRVSASANLLASVTRIEALNIEHVDACSTGYSASPRWTTTHEGPCG